MPSLCNVDGRLLPEDEATVPVLDRGFLFGDSVYEVTRTHAEVPFAWRAHLDRLRASADGIGMELELPAATWMRRVTETVAAARRGADRDRDCYLRWIVTRGTATAPSISLEHAPGPQRVVILARPLVERRSGLPVRLAVVSRAARADAPAPGIKSGNYLGNVVGLAEARRRGADECLFVNADGRIAEASTANVWLVFADGTVATPAPAAGLLAGITRTFVTRAARRAGLEPAERDLDLADLERATEVFLSGTLREIAPVVAIDGREPSGGAPGPVTRALIAAFGVEVEAQRAIDAAELRDLLGRA